MAYSNIARRLMYTRILLPPLHPFKHSRLVAKYVVVVQSCESFNLFSKAICDPKDTSKKVLCKCD
jgi:hypothetical protein